VERHIDIALSPARAVHADLLRAAVAEEAGVPEEALRGLRIVRRTIDARRKEPLVVLRVAYSTEGALPEEEIRRPVFREVGRAHPVIIIGSGPAGLFCALELLTHGLRPILLERGRDVRARRRDLARITRDHIVDPDSNYAFGEGGAGTFSDGKLYTRSTKRGDIRSVLRTLVAFGASPDILIDAHPHIGTNKLPGIITAMREAILGAGGEVRFNSRVIDLSIRDGRIDGALLANGEVVRATHVVLATGHGARDIYRMLHDRDLAIEQKPFAVGVRVEHPQALIDRIRYHCTVRDPLLPPASYNLVQQVNGLGVFSFCMCPGGIIAPCATQPDEVVTNGWSPSKRDNPFANSGIVVQTEPRGGGALAGMEFQRAMEHAAWKAGGRRQTAPAQRLEDFIQQRHSTDLPPCSYLPGIVSHRVDELLPRDISLRLRTAFKEFGRKMHGYRTNDAVVVAVESRTSAPVRIPRDAVHCEHPQVRGLHPCGEGAGYAGGIVSAAMDGVRVARAIAGTDRPMHPVATASAGAG
jgi:hypothetical protein